jgi:hypothetical protein
MPVSEFDFSALKAYLPSSQDKNLQTIAARENRRYCGSTSSMTSTLAHFHYLISAWRPPNVSMVSRNISAEPKTFTTMQRAPSSIFLRRLADGRFAIDADKSFDSANILSMLGKSMEKLMTLPKEEYEQYKLENSSAISEEQRSQPEAFHFTTIGDFLLRSQLDAYDPRLPGAGMFDLKTRAVVTVRMDAENHEEMNTYEIISRTGEWKSFEREYFDMIRSAFLKYSLQVRMGRMDGIFVAFHNTQRIFGFQYVSINEMDFALHGTKDTTTGDTEFKLSLELLNRCLDRAVEKFPNTSIRLHFEARETRDPFMYVFAEPVAEDEIKEVQSRSKAAVAEWERKVLGTFGDAEGETASQISTPDSPIEVSTEDSKSLEAAISEPDFDGISDLTEPHSTEQAVVLGQSSQEVPQENQANDIQANSSDRKSSEASANSTIIDEISPSPSTGALGGDKASDEPQSSAEVLGMVLTVRNRVNRHYVVRPINLRSSDTWTLEYSLADIISQDRAATLLEACKKRRRGAYLAKEGSRSGLDFYLRKMRDLSRQGKLFRTQQDAQDAARKGGPVVYGKSQS